MATRKRKLLITAGPTREMLDPVRFISNLSTGEMGYTLAETAKKKYDVTLISGPTALKPPKGIRYISIESAKDLQKTLARTFWRQDILVMSAAVCDFTAAKASREKIRRTKVARFVLKRTPDILAGLAKKKGKRVVIGFCLETQDWIANGKRKLKKKGLDGIVANYYKGKHIPFGNRRIHTAFIDKKGQTRHLRGVNKRQISRELLKWLETLS